MQISSAAALLRLKRKLLILSGLLEEYGNLLLDVTTEKLSKRSINVLLGKSLRTLW